MKYIAVLIFLFSQQIFAVELSSNIPPVDPVSSSYLLKLIIAMVFILLLIFGLAWIMKKMQLTQHSNNGLIQIVSAISVGQRDRIALIQVGEEQLLVGLTPGRIETLHMLKSPVKVGEAKQDNQSFSEKFNSLLNRDRLNRDKKDPDE